MRAAVVAALAFALGAAAPVAAQPDRLTIPLLSLHHEGDSDHNWATPGVFATWDRPRISYSAGVYLNSHRRLSVAFAAAVPIWRPGDWTISAFGGIALYPGEGRRFDLSFGDWVPGIGAEIRRGRFVAQVFPSSDRIEDVVVTLGITLPYSGLSR